MPELASELSLKVESFNSDPVLGLIDPYYNVRDSSVWLTSKTHTEERSNHITDPTHKVVVY